MMRIHRDRERRAGRAGGRARLLAVALAGAVLASASGCEVINPGPVGDEFIDLPASQRGLVNGSWERMNRVIGWNAYRDALPAREIFPGGQTGNYGHSISRQSGNMGNWNSAGPQGTQGNTSYNNAQQARWIAEEAIRRFEDRGDVADEMMASAYIAAGYGNRVNGDNYCWGAIDSGPLIEGAEYWQRAEEHFTNALTVADGPEQQHQAYAGRAQARLALEDWTGAMADAQQVPDDFELYVRMGDGGNRNHVFFGQQGQPYRGWTATFTFYHGYYEETGDPRTPWRDFPQPTDRVCVGALQGFPGGGVPCTQAWKYQDTDDDILVASGAEMRLVEAEAMLRINPGNWAAAMALINANRVQHASEHTGQPLEPWVANDLDDAWTYLMRERGIELWLEGRRFADMRRWEPYIRDYGTWDEAGEIVLELPRTTPGELDWPCFECVMLNPENNLFTTNLRGRPALIDQSRPRELCYNLSTTERNNNPHFIEDEEGEEDP